MNKTEFAALYRWAQKSLGTEKRLKKVEDSPAGTASWGDIEGTLSSQTDLQSAIDAKANSSHTHAISAVTGLQTALDARQAAGSYASSSHNHSGVYEPVMTVGASAAITAVPVNVATGSAATLATKSISVSAGDQVEITLIGSLLNNSGGTVTPTVRFTLGSLSVELADGATTATNASNRNVWTITGRWSIPATNSAIFAGEFRHGTAAAANAGQTTALANNRSIFQTTASNLTGTVTCEVKMFSSSITATQTFTVHSWTVRKTAAV